MYMRMPAWYISVFYQNKADMSSELLIMFRDFVVNYKHIVVHARDMFDMSRAVIDHQKDRIDMSGNKYVLTRYKAVNYSDIMIMSLYITAMYMRNGPMYMYKMGTLSFLETFTVLFLCKLFY